MRIDLITLFPEFVAQLAGHGVVGRAQERGLLALHGWNPRDYAEGSYRRVDDRPFGGGPGMVMLIDPLRTSISAARGAHPAPAKVAYLSPQGAPLTQAKVRELATRERLILLCGRYEGIDERLIAAEVDEEISIGDYVLSGGELAAPSSSMPWQGCRTACSTMPNRPCRTVSRTACSIARTTPGRSSTPWATFQRY